MACEGNYVLSLQELCCRTIVRRTSVYAIDSLPLPPSVKSTLKSYALTTSQCFNTLSNNSKKIQAKQDVLIYTYMDNLVTSDPS
ncbi:hypothetical protein FF38_01060 [Lucilia cuprina]|uniref:SOCS box domain-containing protein n=1 Tax=Lucilia cuprina TaxID=7375 RepID=A0A0L0C5W6_LUCCU|nr:hypothetical protein FF38_01060 [Lucilia cuprina]